VITVTGLARTIYIGGQDALDVDGNIVGKGDLAAQTHQVLVNLRNALAAADARPEHIIKWNVYLVQGQSLQAGFAAFQQFWGHQPNPPTITGIFVSELAHPDFLVEMDAIAVVPA
jgi:enamine deaminase RidA (YjgF/YER057c/UK114 family)